MYDQGQNIEKEQNRRTTFVSIYILHAMHMQKREVKSIKMDCMICIVRIMILIPFRFAYYLFIM